MSLQITPLGFQWQTADPFLFCAYHKDAFPRGNADLGPASSLADRNIGMDFELRDGWRMYHGETVPGFPGHPHRGFETVTIVQQGLVDHADSLGAAGRYGNGDVQWLTAGRGVQHSEMFPLLQDQQPNPLLLFQIWLNLPARNKLVPPHFTMFWSERLPRLSVRDAAGRATRLELTAGAYGEVAALPPPPDSWAAGPENHVWIWVIDMEPQAQWSLPAAVPGLSRTLYFFEGEQLQVDGEVLPVLHSCRLRSERAVELHNGARAARLLLLQGRPIGEPVAHHGPFVMNTREELLQAFTDYQRDQFGGWPWPRLDQVHARRGRFALYADGREERPGTATEAR